MKPFAYFLTLLLCVATALAASAESFDWPQWQGPDRNAVSKESGLLKEWPKDGPSLFWKAKKLGGGYSEPAIAAGKIYGMSERGDEEVVWALSEKDGKPLWSKTIGPAYHGASPGDEGPACTPTVDGDKIFIETMAGDVASLEAKDATVAWQRSLTKDFGGHVAAWRYRESPLMDVEKVICTLGC